MARSALFLAVALVAVAAAAAAATAMPFSSINMKHASSLGWQLHGEAEATLRLSPTICPARTNMDALTTFATRVSNPRDPLYTEYKTAQELAAMTSPAAASLKRLTAWLMLNGVAFTQHEHSQCMKLDLSVEQANALFDTTFRTALNRQHNQAAVVAEMVNVPVSVAADIEAIFGVHGLPLPPRAQPKLVAELSVTPAVIEMSYNISGVKPTGSTANRQAVAEFQGQLLSQSDLSTFFKQYVPNAKAGDDKVYKYVSDSQQGEGVEANLDIQYIMGVAPGIKTEAWQYAGQDFCTDLKTWTQQIISTTNPPNLFSVSYGWQGQMSQLGCSTDQIQSIDNDFKTVTASGVTFVIASGDSGSGYTSFFGQDPKLYSSWPAGSQWVTAVGATRFMGSTPANGEEAVTSFGSGGGFSRIVTPAPAFQTAAIKKFYTEETKAPKQSTYGFGGRGTPDVAALGSSFTVIVGGSPNLVGGTSAATPTFGAVVSLLNEARTQAGKKPLGCLNQWIYQNPTMFNDITVGSDRIDRSGLPVALGFDCEAGWDPVTGWGTPSFQKMLKAAMAA